MVLIKMKAAFVLSILYSMHAVKAKELPQSVVDGISEAMTSHKFDDEPVGVREGTVLQTDGDSVITKTETKLGSQLQGLADGTANPYANSLVSNGLVIVDIVTSDPNGLRALLNDLGAENIYCAGGTLCSAAVPVNTLSNLEEAVEVDHAFLSMFKTSVGSVTSEGDAAILADDARELCGATGADVSICIISDSFDCLGGAAADIASGDLPPLADIDVLLDSTFDRCTDEGRAILQVVFDVAPEANFKFWSAADGMAAYVRGIQTLTTAGCNVIIDDITYFREPFFQDGLIAQAVNTAVNNGITYLSAAGDFDRDSWTEEAGFIASEAFLSYGTFDSSGSLVFDILGPLHQFGTDASGQSIVTQKLVLPNIQFDFVFMLQWDEPYGSASGPSSTSDLDLFLFKDSVYIPNLGGLDTNVGGDPSEVLVFNPSWLWVGSPAIQRPTIEIEMAIALFDGPAPSYMKLIVGHSKLNTDIPPAVPSVIFEFPTISSTIFGHANSALACSIGAANYVNTPEFGVSPALINEYSSVGGTPVFFLATGTRRGSPAIRQQPCVTGPDGVSITGTTGIPSPFFGTSAAVAHAAGVAALIIDLAGPIPPSELYDILRNTASDMVDPLGAARRKLQGGQFDFATGFGFINAYLAIIDLCPSEMPSSSPTIAPTPVPTVSPTQSPTSSPTTSPTTATPTVAPTTVAPTPESTPSPTTSPTTAVPTPVPTTIAPTPEPTPSPTTSPTTAVPTPVPTTIAPTPEPTQSPTNRPTTASPTESPSDSPSLTPTTSVAPSASPTRSPTDSPTISPTVSPTASPTQSPTDSPTLSPSLSPSAVPSISPAPSVAPSVSPTESPTPKPGTCGPEDRCIGYLAIGSTLRTHIFGFCLDICITAFPAFFLAAGWECGCCPDDDSIGFPGF